MSQPNLGMMTYQQLQAHFLADLPPDIEDAEDYLQDVVLAMAAMDPALTLHYIREGLRDTTLDGTRRAALLYAVEETDVEPQEHQFLARACLHSQEPDLLAAAIEECMHIGDVGAEPSIRPCLQHATVKVRGQALKFYCDYFEDIGIPLLVAAANDSNAAMRAGALELMANCYRRCELPLIATATERLQEDDDNEVRMAALRVFVVHRYVDGIPLLRVLFRQEPDDDVRNAIAQTINTLRDY